MRTVMGYLRPFALRVCCGVTVKFTAAVLELTLPLLLAHIINVCVPAGDVDAIWRMGGLMMALAFGAAFCNITANRMAAWVSMEVTRRLRRDVYSRVEGLSCAQMDRFSISSLVSRLTNDTYHVHQMFDKVQRGGIRAPMLVLGGLVLTFLQAPALGLVQLVICSLTFCTIALVTRKGIPHYTKAQTVVDDVVRIIRENASGVRVIKALACQGRERARFEGANERARAAEEKAGCVMAAANPMTDFLLNTGLVLVVAVGAALVNIGKLDPGHIVAFLSYFALIQTATLGMAKIFVKISKGAASARRIEEILLAPADQLVQPSKAVSGAELGMEGVSFSYLGVEKDLEDANFTLQSGETLGILGPTGSGKTTLVSLLLRFYEPQNGSITIDGVPVGQYSRDGLRRRLALVLQDTWLFGGTIAENIAYGTPGATMEQIVAAAKAARIHRFITSLPEGYDTVLTDEGAGISKGQRQLLAIARCLLTDADIVILDEATSNVDTETEGEISRAMEHLRQGRTCFVIAHRLATIRGADCILVLDQGGVAEQGTHEELLAAGGIYAGLYAAQWAGDSGL